MQLRKTKDIVVGTACDCNHSINFDDTKTLVKEENLKKRTTREAIEIEKTLIKHEGWHITITIVLENHNIQSLD